MSLIIGFNVRDGVVVASDRCTTHHENQTTSHNFDSRKIVVLDNRLVVLHSGDYFVSNNVTTHEFLESCADLIVPNMDVTALPLAILSKYKTAGYDRNNTFLVCGFDKNNNGFIYRIIASENSVEQICGNKNFDGVWVGIADVAAPILRKTACNRISILDAAILCKLAIEASGKAQFYGGKEITVGDKADVYVMHRSGNVEWFSGDAGYLAQKDQKKVDEVDE